MMRVGVLYNGPRYTTGGYWLRGLRRMGHRAVHLRDYESTGDGLDLIIRVDDGRVTGPGGGGGKCPRALIATDTTNDRARRLIEVGKGFDFIFFPQRLGMEDFAKAGYDSRKLFYLPNAGDERTSKRIDVRKQYDVAMIGSDYVSPLDGFSRADFFDMVRKRHPRSYLGRCKYTQMPKVYSAAKIGLNVASGDVNMRNFEITASGTMLLTEEVNSVERLGELYEEGVECVTFGKRDWDGMFKKIDYYLEHDAEREVIATKGYERFLRCHTYEKRIAEVLRVVADRTSQM